jgi:hypothetical protein
LGGSFIYYLFYGLQNREINLSVTKKINLFHRVVDPEGSARIDNSVREYNNTTISD